jgi:histidinol phosphatase-like enzyme (inositol monophosphatase family)
MGSFVVQCNCDHRAQDAFWHACCPLASITHQPRSCRRCGRPDRPIVAGPERASTRAVVIETASKAHLGFAHTLADRSGAVIRPYFRKALAVASKGGRAAFDPVTAADRAAERIIRKAILARYPHHGIIGEEYGNVAGEGRYHWVIDPIDGTRAFIMGSPLWGTLIGLIDGTRPTLGLMDQPFTTERFWSDGRRARWRRPDGRQQRLRTRPCARLADAILSSTHPDLFASGEEAIRFGALKSRVLMARYGGDCYGYCLLAAGCVDLIVEAGLKPYDVVALIPIVEAAGGFITTWDGAPATAGGRIIAAGDERMHQEAMAILGR